MKGKILSTGVLQLEAKSPRDKKYLCDLFKDGEATINGKTEYPNGKVTVCVFKISKSKATQKEQE